MITKKLFLASSSELKEDRKEFEIFINRKNKDWIARGVFLELVVWEDFLDAVSQTRLQDQYNSEIRQCDLFVMLFSTKVGQYTEEEFETAFGQFKATNKPLIFTYFKDAEISTGTANKKELMSFWAFQEKLNGLGHFYTVYKNIDDLKFKFNQQLDKLAKAETSAIRGATEPPGEFSLETSARSYDKVTGTIDAPKPNDTVARTFECSGTVAGMQPGLGLWLAVEVGDLVWPREGQVAPDKDNKWRATVFEDGATNKLSVALFVGDSKVNKRIQKWLEAGRRTGNYAELRGIPGARRIARVDGLHRP